MIKIHSQGITLSKSVREYTKDKIRLALNLYTEKIRRADIYLADVNGPKGGKDKRCKIKINADGCNSVFVQDTSEDLYQVINTCSHRARRTIKRRLDQVIQAHRKRPHERIIGEPLSGQTTD